MKGKNILLLVLGVLLVVGILFYIGDFTEPQTISLLQDTIFMNVEERDYTYIEVDDEINPYDEMILTINDVQGSSVTVRGSDPYSYFMVYDDGLYLGKPGTACYLEASINQCCRNLGYSRFYSDSGWNVCVLDSVIYPEYIIISIGGTEVYNWDGEGEYPTQSDNFAEVVNNACDLTGESLTCADTDYALNDAQTLCVYFQPIELGDTCLNENSNDLGLYEENTNFRYCEMDIVENQRTFECNVKVEVDTGNGYGQINMGLSVSGEGDPASVNIIDPPETQECNELKACSEGFICSDNNECVEEEIEQSTENLIDSFKSYIESNTLFVGIITSLILIGGLLVYVIRRK